MRFSSKTLKIRCFPSFSDIERRFLQCLRRKIGEEFLLKEEFWIVDLFQHLKKKIPIFSANAFVLGCHNCLQPIQTKILRTFSWKCFFLLSLLERDGGLSEYAGKKFAWAKFFRLLTQVIRLTCQNSKVFVHLSSLKLLKNSENHRGTTWEFFRKFWTFWNLVEHRVRNFLPFDKKFTVGRFKADFHVSREKSWRENAFLKDSGTLTKSSLGS